MSTPPWTRRAAPPCAGGMDPGPGSRIALADLRSRLADVVATGVTDPPAPRPPRLRRGRLDLVFAADDLPEKWASFAEKNSAFFGR